MLAHAGIIIDFQLRVIYFRYSSEYDIQVDGASPCYSY
jgi:hypothetical protein